MSAVITAATSAPGAPHTPASFASSLIGLAMLLVTADGELDAGNARDLAAYVDRVLDAKRRLIVDLRGLSFFGTQGFSSLHQINVACSRTEVNWVLVPGREASRLLRICDPERALPVAETLDSAIGVVSRPLRNHLRPLPQN
ncbi:MULTISPECIES: STAS domain-containing protein [unclassified Mycobacterium]|uniref:STAS domain-containing protein n=1 Tax=unclassified Mycobacterium TaxID=2642494 RepID=UPI0029C8AA28|nr:MULTISPECIES: STAS domain-containing protein [unclassified Mycobacterium]